MNPNLQRALMLYQQARYEQAEKELQQSLALEPQEAYAHSLLGLCLMHREKFAEATEEAEQAIHLEPDMAFAHYALAMILHQRHRNDEAIPAINEAIRLEPEDADYLAVLAQIQLDERRWPAALEAAERGLQHDPEHVGCNNLRAMALVKLGRKAEAGETIDTALKRNPDNSLSHANQGWTLLEKGEPKKALEHFRESLRLDPENEWARSGIIEALKARNIIYALMLKYFLWMAKLPRGAQWGILLGGYFGNQALGSLARSNPDWAPWILPLRILYITFAVMTWLASPLFNLMLRLNRFGRLALSAEEITASNWIGACLLVALASLGGCFVYGFDSVWLMGLLVFGLLLLPLSGTFKCQAGWPRNCMALYTGAMAATGMAALYLMTLESSHSANEAADIGKTVNTLLGIFTIGAIGSGWVANILIMQRPKR